MSQIRSFDLVVLDRMLPGVDGLTVCRELRSNPRTRSVAIIILTALGDDSDVIGGLRKGADDYLTKPFSTNVLVARVQALLRRKQGDTAF